ncbi:MAG: acyl-CoA dehydrogenase family protein [Deltaproteobacteria bacterium]|nr:acyl-CoA dehydrogenase family protein [Deltaproteobacteria bacterium]
MDETLPGELQAIKKLARDFARNEIDPRALELDAAPKDRFPWDLVRKGGEVGLLSMTIPEAYGGSGQAVRASGLVMEELCWACAGVANIFGAHGLGLVPLFIAGSDELKERVYRDIVAAEKAERPKLAAFAITEPGAGSDVEDEQGSKHAALSTVAIRDGDEYVLNGRKVFISNGSVASYITVFATVDRAEGIKAWTCFLVTPDMKGFSVGRVEDKMGQRACPAAELIFEDMRVPKKNRVGKEKTGWFINRTTLAASRGPVGAIAVGIAQRALDLAVAYAKERRQAGRPIIEHQAVSQKIAEMVIRVEAARLMVRRACHLADTSLPPPMKSAAMAKVFASDTAVFVANEAIQILGGYGYMRDFWVEKCLRDARLTQIYEGTNEINRIAITEEIAAGR